MAAHVWPTVPPTSNLACKLLRQLCQKRQAKLARGAERQDAAWLLTRHGDRITSVGRTSSIVIRRGGGGATSQKAPGKIAHPGTIAAAANRADVTEQTHLSHYVNTRDLTQQDTP